MVVDEEALTETAKIPKEFLDSLVFETDKAISDRHPWEMKLKESYSKRYGLRTPKTFPWPGCANLNIPIVEKIIRRLAPTLQSAVFRVNPIVTIEPLGNMQTNTARALEQGYDWLVRYNMDGPREQMIFIEDAMLTYGMSVLKTVWEYDSVKRTRTIRADFFGDIDRKAIPVLDLRAAIIQRLGLNPDDHQEQIAEAEAQFRAGDDHLTVEIKESVYDAPRWWYCDPIDVIVPWDSGIDVDRLPWIAHRMRKTKREIEVAKKNGRYDDAPAKAVIDAFGRASRDLLGNEVDWIKRRREGLYGFETNKESTAELREIYFHYDLDGDGVSEKYVGTYAVVAKQWLRVIPFEYEHGEWPFTRFAFETTEPRWYSSRGIPEHLADLSTEINANHNAWLDSMAIKNCPSFISRTGSLRDKAIRFRPGIFIEAQRGIQDVQPLSHQPMDFSYNNMEENLKGWCEETIGTPDFGISNINQRVERRTATEVEQIQQSTGAIADALLERFQESMRRVHRQTLLLWAQYGEDQVMVRVTGTEEVTQFVRFDLLRDYDLAPTGRLDNLSPQARLSRAGAMLQLAESPVFGPYMRPFEIAREIVENLDYRNADRYLQEPGVFDQEAIGKQASEISSMVALGVVWPVDQRDPHQIHAQACMMAIQSNQDDEKLVQLVSVHLAMHLFFMGQKGPLEQLQQQGVQVQQIGMQLQATIPQPQPEQAQEGEAA